VDNRAGRPCDWRRDDIVAPNLEVTMPRDVELSVSHVGFYVTDLPRMERFYVDVLGYVVTDRGQLGETGLVFLSQHPEEHHEIVLASGRPGNLPFNIINQISLRAADLSSLKKVFRRISGVGVADLQPVTHGNAISLYFRDPEGNRVEVFIDTPWYVAQPHRVAIDVTLSDDEIWRRVHDHCRSLPGFKSRSAWEKAMIERMGLV
jgi:catechol-2,3-dioxygenase